MLGLLQMSSQPSSHPSLARCMLRFPDMDIDLTQRKDVFAWIIGLTFLVALAYATLSILAPFTQALLWAGVFASLLTPLQRKLARWIPSDGARAGVTCLIAIVALFVPLTALGAMLTAQLVSSVQYLQQSVDTVPTLDLTTLGIVERLQGWLAATFGEWASVPAPNLKAALLSVAERLSQWLLSNSSAAAGNIAGFGFGFFVMVMALFYFLRDGDQLVGWIVDLFPATLEQKQDLLEKLDSVVASSVISGVVVAVVQGVLGGFGFYLVGLPSVVLWGTAMALLSFLPVVGPSLVWLPAAVILAVQGRWVAAIFLVAWGAVAVGLIDNILRPMLISGSTKMHPFVAFIAVLGGMQAFGVIGFLLGPMIAVAGGAVLETLRGDGDVPATNVPAADAVVADPQGAP